MYLVTTKADRLPADHQIIMVDGTVPDWEAKPEDLHWDHHRPGGADVQMDEIPSPQQQSLLEECTTDQPPCFVTTMVDPDACCAAAWVQLPPEVLTLETIAKLKAIAWDCDHLMVPDQLAQYAEFAAKAVVALKSSNEGIAAELGLPHERKDWADEHWEAYSSEAFRRGTEWLIEAAKGNCPLHPKQPNLDYTQGTFDRLTEAEQAKNPESGAWGGRRTVGGSAWNTPSFLTVEEIIGLLN